MARCPDCNKFVPYDETEAEVEVEVDEEGGITGTVRIVNACADCGTELREATFDLDMDVAEEVTAHLESVKDTEKPAPEDLMISPGCPKHVAEQPCEVCGWDGTLKPAPWKEEEKGGGRKRIWLRGIGREFGPDDQAGYKEYLKRLEAERIPPRRPATYKPDPTKHVLSVEVSDSERTQRVEGKGRGAKTFCGAKVEFEVTCSCGKFTTAATWEDDIQASSMEEMYT